MRRVETTASGNRWTPMAACMTTFMLLVDIPIVNVALVLPVGFAAVAVGSVAAAVLVRKRVEAPDPRSNQLPAQRCPLQAKAP